MTTYNGYGVYMPYFTAIGGGGESLIERVEVNDGDLRLLTRQLQTMSTQRVLAFFGQRQPVIASVNEVIQENIDSNSLTRDNCIYVAIKGEWVAVFAIMDSKFFEKRVIDKESIVITLFRYLEDIAPTVVLCVDQDTVTNFAAASTNPFSFVAHSPSVYKLVTKTNVALQVGTLETNCGLLERDRDFNVQMLLLNDNGSRFFLHQKKDAVNITVLESNCGSLIQTLIKGYELTPIKVETLVREHQLDLSTSHLRGVVSAHKQYVSELNRQRSSLSFSLLNEVYRETIRLIREEKSSIKQAFFDILDKFSSKSYYLDDQMKASADLTAHDIIIRLLDKPGFVAREADNMYDVCVSSTVAFFAEKLRSMEVKKIEDYVRRSLPLLKFSGLLRSVEIGSRVQSMTGCVKTILAESIESLRRQSALQLNVYAINTQQRADGTCSGLIVAPFLSQITIQPEELFQYFSTGKQKSLSIVYETMRHIAVTAMFPLKTGRTFLLVFDYDNKCQVLVAISSVGSHSLVTRWKISGRYMLLPFTLPTSDSAAVRFVLINAERDPTFTVFEVNESLKYAALKAEHITGRIEGSLASVAAFPVQNKILLFTNTSRIYEVNLSSRVDSRDFKANEIKKQENDGTRIVTKRLVAENGRQYLQVQSVINEKYFILRNAEVIDVYDWNLERQLSLDVQAGSAVKVFSDNKNVYLVAMHQANITSFMFPELGADLTLQQQEETPVEQVQGNPIVDVIYASCLKYGPNSQFIGSPVQNNYVISLLNEDDNFNQKLQTYLKTFRKSIQVTTTSLQDLHQLCEAQPANRHLPAIMSSRTPVHICTVEANNLLPLVDGNRLRVAAERATSIAEAAECMSFAHLERVIGEFCDDRSVRVVSIIGRQSSGKSYLLNQLFGTRFSVAATRCTDGIWMSYARIIVNDDSERSVEQSFLVLDCEGLFSINRNEQEEVKLLLVLAAVSDVTILNQDLNFNRYINKLFANLNNAVGKVSGSSYFHGLLMVAVRDVGSNESLKTTQEFERNIKTINERSEHQFLMRLFRSTMILHCLNHFESDYFAMEVNKIRTKLAENSFERETAPAVSKHCATGRTTLENVKVVLLQVYNDDEQSADEHIKQIDQIRIANFVTAAWGEIAKVGVKAEVALSYSVNSGKLISESDEAAALEEETVELCQCDVQFEHLLGESDHSFGKIKQALEERFFQTTDDRRSKHGYNQRWTAFNTFLEEFVRRRGQLLEEYAQEEIDKLGHAFKTEEKHNLLISLKEKIRSFTINSGFCLEKCALCHLKCLQRKGHKESFEPKKQQLQSQLTAVTRALPVDRPTKVDDMALRLSETKKQFEETECSISKATAELTATEQRLSDATRLQEAVKTLAQTNTEISEKQSSLDSKSSCIDHVDLPAGTLQDFFTTLHEKLHQVQIECANSLRDFHRLENEDRRNFEINLPNLSISTSPLLSTLTTDAQKDNCFASMLTEAAGSIAALHDGLQRLQIPSSVDCSDNTNTNDLNVLFELCSALPELAEKARNMVILGQKMTDAAHLHQKCVNEVAARVQSAEQTVAILESEKDKLKVIHVSLDKEVQKEEQDKAEAEAQLAASQRLFEAKKADLMSLEAKMSDLVSSFTSMQQLERDSGALTAQIDHLTAVVNTMESDHALVLSSAEESGQVADLMLEYLTLDNSVETDFDFTLLERLDNSEWEFVPLNDDVKMNDELSGFALQNYSCFQPNRAKLWSNMLNHLKHIARKKQDYKSSLADLEKRLTSLKTKVEKLQDEEDYEILIAVQGRLASMEVEKKLLEDRLVDVEAGENVILTSKFFKRCRYQQQLFDRLSKDYPLHFENDDLRRYMAKLIELRQQTGNVKVQLTLQSGDYNSCTYKDSALSDTTAAKIDDETIAKELGSLTETIYAMLWNPLAYEERQKSRETLQQWKQRNNELADAIESWRTTTVTHGNLQQQLEQLTARMVDEEQQLNGLGSKTQTLNSMYNEVHEGLEQKEQLVRCLSEKVQNDRKYLVEATPKLDFVNACVQREHELALLLERVLTELTSEAESRRNVEEAIWLKQKIASLTETKLKVQDELAEISSKMLEPAELLEQQLIEQRKSYNRSVAEFETLKTMFANEREYLRLLADQDVLENAISCVCDFNNHECDHLCSICPDEAQLKCKHKAGHDDPELLQRGLAGPKEHCCDKAKHDCPGKCHLCSKPCVYPQNHVNPANHLCASSHQCESRCQYCTSRCRGNLVEKHPTHLCNEDKCPKRCILCGNQCSGPHDHDEDATLVDADLCWDTDDLPTLLTDVAFEDPNDGKMKLKLHLCENEHLCPKLCDKAGVCEIHYVSETREWTQLGSSHEYEYIKPERKSRRCALRIPPGNAWHETVHDCGKQHTCTNTCPECGGFCRESISHEGMHKTAVHRNMEHCYCVTKTKDETIKVQDKSGGKKARVYQAGDVLTPEICTQHCNRKGRAHYHLKPCPGEASCGEKKHPLGVKHCNERFYPHVDKLYDKYLCAAFWSSVNWLPPSENEVIQLCNFVCPHSQHCDEADKHKFCTGGAWHTQSASAAVHTFECGHDFTKLLFNGLDMCFCIDTTGSMAPYIKQSAESIKKIMSGVVPQLAAYGKDTSCLRFAVVGYKDHCDPQVVEHVDFCSDTESILFLDSLQATGGGDAPEAVLDGLCMASKLSWREDCEKLLFHILDAPPHGKKFTSLADTYPDGCPCKLNEIDVLKVFKAKSIKYYVIPLTSDVNQMISIFGQQIPVVRKELSDSVVLSSLIPAIVSHAIEDSELTATYSEYFEENNLD